MVKRSCCAYLPGCKAGRVSPAICWKYSVSVNIAFLPAQFAAAVAHRSFSEVSSTIYEDRLARATYFIRLSLAIALVLTVMLAVFIPIVLPIFYGERYQ